MKKFLQKTFGLLLCIGFSSLSYAQDFVRDGIWYDVYDDGEVIVVGADEVTDLVIPATVKDDDENVYKVVAVQESAFENRQDIKTVIFGANVLYLYCDAFKYCKNLQSVTLNEGLEYAQWWCFNQTQITELTIPSTLKTFECETFGGMSQLKKVTWLTDTPWDINGNINDIFSDVDLSQVVLYLPETADALSFADEGWNYKFKNIWVLNKTTVNINEDGPRGIFSVNDNDGYYGLCAFDVDENLIFKISIEDILYLPFITVDGVPVELDDNGTYTLASDGEVHHVYVWWEDNPNVISHSISVNQGGQVLVNGEETYGDFYSLRGDDIVLTFAPNNGYLLKKLEIGGVDVTEQVTDNQYTISAVDDQQEINVTFIENISKVNVYAENATVLVNGEPGGERIEVGSEVVISVTPNENYAVTSILLDEQDITSEFVDGKYTIPAIEIGNHNLIVETQLEEGTIECFAWIADGKGTILANGEPISDNRFYGKEGDRVTITLQPADCYRLAYFSVNDEDKTTEVVDNTYVIDALDGELNIEVYFEELPQYHFYGEIYDGEFVLENGDTDTWVEDYLYIGNPFSCSFLSYDENLVPRATLQIYNWISDKSEECDVTNSLIYDENTGLYTFQIQMDEECEVYLNVQFVENKASIRTSLQNADIALDIDDPDNIPVGSDVTITVTPKDGYVLTNLIVDNVDVTDQVVNGQYVIHQIIVGDHNVRAIAKVASIAFNDRYMTFCSNDAMEFPLTGDVKAWIVTGYETDRIHLTRVEVVPAGTGVLLEAEEGTVFDIIYSNKTAYYSNMLVGTTRDITLNTSENRYYNNRQQNGYNFVFANGSNGYGFYKLSQRGTLAAGKAYLWLPAVAVNNANVKAFKLEFDEDATGIDSLSPSVSESEGAVYDLSGRRVNSQPKKGIYIVNGKKTFIK